VELEALEGLSVDVLSCNVFLQEKVINLELHSIGFVVSMLAIFAKADYAKDLYNVVRGEDLPNIGSYGSMQLMYYPMSYRKALLVLQPFYKLLPVVFLDEFIVSGDRSYAFFRNIFRVLGVVCVTMGTDSAASNLLQKFMFGDPASSLSGKSQTWVYVWHKLPPPKLDAFLVGGLNEKLELLRALPSFASLVSWIKTVPCVNSRIFGLFLEAINHEMSKSNFDLYATSLSTFLHNVIAYASERLRFTKKFSSIESCIGQVAMNFKTWREFRVGPDVQNLRRVFLINCHYANLYASNELHYFSLELLSETLYLVDDPWRPSAVFPEFTGNELFYLMLMNVPQDKYFSDHRVLTAADAFRIYFPEIVTISPNQLNTLNLHHHDGFSHEHFCHFVFMISSRFSDLENPYMGLSVSQFILNLVKNFDTSNNLIQNYTLDPGNTSDLREHLVPYLVPMAAEFSEHFSQLASLNVRPLQYTYDQQQIDAEVERLSGSKQPFHLGEFKAHDKNLPFSSVLLIASKAFSKNLAKNKDPEVPEFLYIVARSLTSIDVTSSSCSNIRTILNQRNLIFHQVGLVDNLVKIESRVVQEKHYPSRPTLHIVLFSLTDLYGKRYQTNYNSMSVPATSKTPTAEDTSRPKQKNPAPISAGVRRSKRACK